MNVPTDLIKGRYERRVVGANGHPYSEETPRHGHSTSYVAFGCRCAECQAWQANYHVERINRMIHNMRIIAKLPCPEAPAPVPEPVSVPPSTLTEERIEELVEEAERGYDLQVGVKVNADRLPPMTNAVRGYIRTVEMLHKVAKAYFEPDFTANSEGRERRFGQGLELIVSDEGRIVWVHTRAEVPDAVVAYKPKGLPKAKGGRGGRAAVTKDSLIEQLTAAGCTVAHTGSGHLRISKGERSIILPATTSDRRAMLNALSDARKQKLL